MRKIVYSLLPATLLVLSSTAQAEQPPLPEAEFHIEAYRKTIALRGEVNGTPGLFLLDTAGGITLLSPKYAEQIGCKP